MKKMRELPSLPGILWNLVIIVKRTIFPGILHYFNPIFTLTYLPERTLLSQGSPNSQHLLISTTSPNQQKQNQKQAHGYPDGVLEALKVLSLA